MSDRTKITTRMRKLLGAYADGELSPALELEVERALKSSPELRSELERLLELKKLVAASSFEPPHERLERLSSAIEVPAEPAPRASRRSVRMPEVSSSFRTVFLGIAAVLLVLLLSFGYYTRHRNKSPVVRIEELEVPSGSDVKVFAPKGAPYSVIRITTHERNSVVVHEVKTAEGYSCDLEVDPETGDAAIRLVPTGDDKDDKE